MCAVLEPAVHMAVVKSDLLLARDGQELDLGQSQDASMCAQSHHEGCSGCGQSTVDDEGKTASEQRMSEEE